MQISWRMWQLTAWCSLFSQDYSLHQRVSLRWDLKNTIRTACHEELISTRQVYPDLFLDRTCKNGLYAAPKAWMSQAFLRTFQENRDRFWKATRLLLKRVNKVFNNERLHSKSRPSLQQKLMCQPTFDLSSRDDQLDYMHAPPALNMFLLILLLLSVITMVKEQKIPCVVAKLCKLP